MPTVFFSYCHKDEPFRDQLEIHLSALKRQKAIESWHDRKIIAGSAVDDTIDQHLDTADVILLLISPDFIASDYCYEREVQRALQRHTDGTSRVIPVILRPCDWHGLPFGKLLATPTDGRAITLWPNPDEAFLDVVKSIKSALSYLGRSSPASALASSLRASSSQIPSENKLESEGSDIVNPYAESLPASKMLPGGSKSTEAKVRVKVHSQLPRVGIDMGTRYTRIYVEGQGIALDEPSAIAVDGSLTQIVGVGTSALELVFGQTGSRLIRPTRESIVSDPDAAFHMLQHFLTVLGIRPGSHVVFAVPEAATKASLKTLFDIAKRAKVGKVEFVQRTLLAAVSGGVPAESLRCGIVVEIGAGTTDVTVLSEHRICYSNFVRVGGDHVDETILRYIKRAYSLLIGERVAELIKVELGSAWPSGQKQLMQVKGRHLILGGLRGVTLSEAEVLTRIHESIEPIVSAIREARDRTPPSVLSGAADDIVVISGGSALIRGLSEFLQDRLQAHVVIQKDPLRSVVTGFKPLFNGDWKSIERLIYPSRRLRLSQLPARNAEIPNLPHR